MPDKSSFDESAQRIKLLEKELVEYRAREDALKFIQFAVEHSSDAAFWIDSATRIIFVNQSACRNLGYDRAELLRMRVGDIDPAFSTGITGPQWSDLKKNGSLTIETQHRRKDGTFFPVEVVSNFVQFEGHEYNCAFARDLSKRKEVEALFAQSEEFIKNIYRAAPLAIGVVVNRVITQLNERTCEMLGYTQDELLGKNTRLIYPTEEEYDYVGQEKYDRMRKFGIGTVETRWQCKDGHVIDILLSSVPLNPMDWSMGITFTALDITDRKRAEEKMRESSELYQMLFNNVNDAVLVHQPLSRERPGPYVEINDMACRVYGYTKEEFIKLTPLDLSIPEKHPQVLMRIRRLFEEKHILFETVHMTKAGKSIPVEIHSHMIDLKGKPTILSIVRDIAGRKQAERSLRESEDLLNSIVESMTDGIMVMDKNFHITFWNRAMERISKLTHKKDMEDDKTAWNFFPELSKKGIDRMIRRAMEGHETRQDDIPYYFSDGTVVYTSETCTPLKNEEGAIRGVLNVVRDTTEKRNLETRLEQSQKMEAIGTLAGGIAHDFNNILGIILGNADLAVNHLPGVNPAGHNLQEIHKACLRARDLVKQILGFGRQSEQKFEPLRLTPVIRDSLKFLRASLPATIEIQQAVMVQKDTVRSDVNQINQVLINLCTNAAHAMRDKGGVLKITLENVTLDKTAAGQIPELSAGEFIKLSVSDTGHGMEPHILKRVFDPYFTTKSIGEGTGLGLAVVHGIIKNHQGAVTVQSQPGNGSTFQIWLPLVDAQPLEKREPEQELPKGHECILFVDDEQLIVDMAREIFEHLGYRVVSEQNPEKALELFLADPGAVDLMVTDMTMPKMSGIALAQKMWQLRPEMPVILCTGYSEQINEEKALALGIRAFAMKPLVMGEMARMTRNVLDQCRVRTGR